MNFVITASWLSRKHLRNQIPDNPELRKDLTPDYRFGCKRTSPSNKYYKALALPHCKVIRNRIVSVKDSSIVTEDGNEFQIDVIIFLTNIKLEFIIN